MNFANGLPLPLGLVIWYSSMNVILLSPHPPVGDGNSKVPPLRRESSQGIYGSCVNRSSSVGEDGCMIGELVERELVLVVSVRSCKERDITHV